jgi:exodeoxyribonuclease VII large subunit
MLNTLGRRYPLVEVVLAPTSVQGEAAPEEIVNALLSLNLNVQPDVILLARGGGSIEDLWAFNDEKVARAIVASGSPVISGVGHETDFTIADFVADLRAPTPTAAAELATPDRVDLMMVLNEYHQRLIRATLGQTEAQRWLLNDLRSRLQTRTPLTRIQNDRQRLDEVLHRSDLGLGNSLTLQKTKLRGLGNRLEALNPLAILQRGYAVISRSDGKIVRKAVDVQAGDYLNVRVSDGEFKAQVKGD